jgi:hypothetical protein
LKSVRERPPHKKQNKGDDKSAEGCKEDAKEEDAKGHCSTDPVLLTGKLFSAVPPFPFLKNSSIAVVNDCVLDTNGARIIPGEQSTS